MITLLLVAACVLGYVCAPSSWALRPTAFEHQDLLTYLFMHHSPEHLVSNMLVLTGFGLLFEHKHGRAWTLVLFLVAGAAAALAEMAVYPSFAGIMVGASGAVAAFLGAFTTRRYGWLLGLPMLGVLALEALAPPSNTAHMAHFIGFVTGLLFALWRLDTQEETTPAHEPPPNHSPCH